MQGSHPEWVRGLKQGTEGKQQQAANVAPRVGAWIETKRCFPQGVKIKSHPEWVRGLKLTSRSILYRSDRSHPEWVRGLKQVR